MQRTVNTIEIIVIHTVILATIILSTLAIGEAVAADKMLEAKVQAIQSSFDKNGQPYTRLIVAESRTTSGITYEVGVPVMAFGNLSQQVESIAEGDTLKAIVSERKFNGSKSYTLRAVVAK